MKKHLVIATALFGLSISPIAITPIANAAPCRAIAFSGCSGTTDSPMSPKSPKSGKKSPHSAGNPSNPNTGHPPIRFN